jgi:hypothetical protein
MARKKGGNYIDPQQQYPNQYPNQYPQQQYPQQQYSNQYPQQQPTNYTGMIGDTMKNMQPVYDATASIGIAYAIFSAVIATIICGFAIYGGFWVKNINSDKTAKTTGTIKDAICSKTKNDKSCIATINYVVKNVEYSVSETTGIVNKGQTLDIYYDPKNPNNFSLSNNTTNIIGWIIIIVAIIILLSSWGWLIMTIFFKPLAAATGVGAVAGAVIPGDGYGSTFDSNY